MFGRGWRDYEPNICNLGGVGRRSWHFFLYGRSFVSAITLEMLSMFPEGTELQLIVEHYWPGLINSSVVRRLRISAEPERKVSRVTIPVNLRDGFLYRVQLMSPSFAPCNVQDSADRRRLGLAVFGIAAHYVNVDEVESQLIPIILSCQSAARGETPPETSRLPDYRPYSRPLRRRPRIS